MIGSNARVIGRILVAGLGFRLLCLSIPYLLGSPFVQRFDVENAGVMFAGAGIGLVAIDRRIDGRLSPRGSSSRSWHARSGLSAPSCSTGLHSGLDFCLTTSS